MARLIADDHERAGRRVIRIDLGAVLDHGRPLPEAPPSRTPGGVRSDGALRGAGTVFVVMDAPYSPLPLWLLGAAVRRGKRLIALWFWELEDMPSSWRWSARCFDEIQTFSEFNFEAARKLTHRARLMPVPRVPPAPRRRRFAEDTLRVLSLFNMSANFARKNPEGAIAAFQRAFGASDRHQLVLKVTEGDLFPEGLDRLRDAAAGAPNIELIEDACSEQEMFEMFERADVYLSLHRSEGLGEPLLRAVGLGMHVVATGWSGNVDFMRGRDRCALVPFTLVPVDDPQRMYPTSSRWAEPDIDAAADILRRIAEEHRA